MASSLPDNFPLSLRTWPSDNDPASLLPSQIPRIHAQRGNFRNISEDILEKEIIAAEAGTSSIGKENEASSDDDEEEEKPGNTFKELNASKEQIVQELGQAYQSAQFALDFISLMLSRFIPNSASTMSAWTKDPGERNIPVGTLGADMTQGSRHTDAQKLDNKLVATGWKILSINKSVDSILDAATRLEQEMAAEAKYWEDILSVKEKDWAISYATQTSQNERLDTRKSDGTLVVRFGFSESAPEFRNRGLAILQRTDDGSIALQTDVLQTRPKGLQVRIENNGIESGHSAFSLFKDLDISLESQVLKARNAIFEQELWHELLRESRNLVSYGVVVQASSISIPLSSTKKVIIKFATDFEEPSSPFSSNEDSKIANTLSAAIHLLLTYSHRQRLRQRSQPPPPISTENNFGNPPTQPCTLLRPVISHLYHQAAIASLHSLLSPLTKILNSAGLPSNYSITQKPYLPAGNQADKYLYLPQSASEKIIESLIDNIGGEVIFHIKNINDENKRVTFTIQFRTALFPVTTTQYRVLGAGEAYKAPNAFGTMNEVREYILFATTCAIAEFFIESPELGLGADQENQENQMADTTISKQVPRKEGFHATVHANVIREAIPDTTEFREISFVFETLDSIPLSNLGDSSAIGINSKSKSTALFPPNENDMKLALRVERKYKYNHDAALGESENRRTGGTSVWWVGGGEKRELKEVIEGGVVKRGMPIRWPPKR